VTQSHNKLCNWHADSSRRSIVQLSRERTAPRISSWTSLKHYIHFSFILKLIIFIYKQLKRPVAFSVVHALLTWSQWMFSHESFCPHNLPQQTVVCFQCCKLLLLVLQLCHTHSHVSACETCLCVPNVFVASSAHCPSASLLNGFFYWPTDWHSFWFPALHAFNFTCQISHISQPK